MWARQPLLLLHGLPAEQHQARLHAVFSVGQSLHLDAGAATSLRTDWFFRSASCNSFEPSAQATALQRGATLLYATAATMPR
jgi:hypothetical protein